MTKTGSAVPYETQDDAAYITALATGRSDGDSLIVSGARFTPGESVQILVSHQNADGSKSDELAGWSTVADASGRISALWLIDASVVGADPIVVTATGEDSGVEVTSVTTETDSRLTFVSVPDTVKISTPFDVTVLLEQNCCDGQFAPMPNREVSFYTRIGDCGVDPDDIPVATVTTDDAGMASATLTIDVVGNYVIGVKYEGESEPSETEDPNSACFPDQRVAVLAAIDCAHVEVEYEEPEIECVSAGAPHEVLGCEGQASCFSTIIHSAGAGDLRFSIPAISQATIDPVSGELCVTPDTAGTYAIEITATDTVGQTAFCTAQLVVTLNNPPSIDVPDTYPLDPCYPADVTISYNVDDPDGNIVSVYAIFEGQQIDLLTQNTVSITGPGTYYIEAWVVDECGLTDVDTMVVTAPETIDPFVDLGDDRAITQCEPTLYCVPFTVSQGLEITSYSGGDIDLQTETICFTPNAEGDYQLTIEGVDICGQTVADTALVHVTYNSAPAITAIFDTTAVVCVEDEVCIPVDISDVDGNLESVSTSLGNYNAETGLLCVPVGMDQNYDVTITATDACGLTDDHTITITTVAPPAPSVDLGDDQDLLLCGPGEVCVDLITDAAQFSVESSLGYYNDQTGQVCFEVSEPGNYSLIVWVTDECLQTAVDTVDINVTMNSAPAVTMFEDTAIYLCLPEEICLPVEVSDPDGNIADISIDGGTYKDGFICFTPYNHGVFEFTLTVTDSCGLTAVGTASVTIRTDQDIVLDCPGDTAIYTCYKDTVYVPVGGIPDLEEISVSVQGLNAWWDDARQSVGIFSECSNSSHITVLVESPCATYTCTFDLTVNCNRTPLVLLPPDTTLFSCGGETLCLPVGVSDPDDNLARVTSNIGQYDPATGKLCFTADTAGVYTISVTAYDECEDYRTDEMLVTVVANTPPTCVVPEDTTLFVCGAGTVSVPVGTIDPDFNVVGCSVVEGPGTIENGYWIYDAPGAGEYTVQIECVDECDASCTSEFTVTIEQNSPPVFDCLDYSEPIFMCELTEFCLPNLHVSDVDDNIAEINLTINGQPVQYNPEGTCFMPIEGNNRIEMSVIDECGESSVCDMPIYVIVNSAPTMTEINDTSLFICETRPICLNLEADDADTNFAGFELVSGNGYVEGDQWCYTPPEAGSSETVTIRAYDSCGAYDEQTFTVDFNVNQPPVNDIPAPGEFFVCEIGEEICVPGFTATDPDGNLVGLTVSYGTLHGDTLCFTADPQITSISVTAVDECQAMDSDEYTFSITVNSAPVNETPTDNIDLVLCTPEEYCLDLAASDVDDNFSHFELVSGFGSIIDNSWCFTPWNLNDNPDVDPVVIRGYDNCGAYCEFTLNVSWTLNNPPVAEDGYKSGSFCFPEERTVYPTVTDADGDILTFTLLFGDGYIDPATGAVTYFIGDTSGVYAFQYEVADSCAADTAWIYDSITLNTEPELFGYDSTVVLCEREEICFEILAEDYDGDNLVISQIDGPGVFTQIDNNTGQTCFWPAEVDSATYVFAYCVADPCSIDKFGEAAITCPPCDPDTVRITVIINRPPTIVCPEAQQFASCDPDSSSYCFPIEFSDPDGEILTPVILSGNAFYDNGYVCVDPILNGEIEVVIAVADSCGAADTCTVAVTIESNEPPTITMGDDFERFLCEPEEICVPVRYSDPNGEILTPEFNFGILNDEGAVCFLADTAGTYTIIGSVTDTCDVTAVDTTVVTVIFNTGPYVDLGPDFEVGLCGTTQVCVPVDAGDVDDNLVSIVPSTGVYDPQTGKVCFDISEEGDYTLIVTVTDECGLDDVDTVVVTGVPDEPPFLSLGDDFSLMLCDIMPVCIDVNTVADYSEFMTNIGQYDPASGRLCFTPETAGEYTVIATVIDSCDLSTTDTVVVTIELNSPPELTCPGPQEFSLCEPTEFCLPLDVTDIDGNLQSVEVTSGNATINGNEICFNAEGSGQFEITVVAVDSCAAADTCIIPVTIELNTPPSVVLGDNFDVYLCMPQAVCFPAEISDLDGDNLDITLTAGVYDPEQDRICVDIDTTGTYVIIATATDTCGAMAADTTVIMAEVAETPTLDLGEDFVVNICEPEEICVDVETNATYQEITTNVGEYDPTSGRVCFWADHSASYDMIVQIIDSCGLAAIDTVHIDVIVNTAPTLVMGPDTSVYLCNPEPICLPVELNDLENNIANIEVIGGTYNNGEICITPYDSGMYTVIMTVTDSCAETASDTANIYVMTDQGADLVCPNDTVLFSCTGDTVCLPVYGIPQEATVEVSGINTWYDYETGTVCFYTECGNTNHVSIKVTTPCNVYECGFTVTIECNAPPLVILPPDTSLMVCGPEQVCLPVGITDQNDNLYSVIVDNGWYDAVHSMVCFDADTSGTYILTVTAEDSCGEVSSDDISVVVDFNSAPYLIYEWADSLISTCVPEVCVPIEAIDPDNNLAEVYTDWGTYNEETGEICFTVDTNGTYCVEVYAVDSCGLADTLTACVNVETGDFVYIDCPTETIAAPPVCGPEEICVDLAIAGSGYQINTSFGEWADNQLCFFADTAGIYTIDVLGSAECNEDSCRVYVEVIFLDPATITCPGDTTVLLCEADTLCFNFTASATTEQVEVQGGYINGDQVCVPILEPGVQVITLIAINDCGSDTCSFTINSTFNSGPTLTAANDTTITACEPYEICFDYTAADPDNNIIEVQSSLGVVIDDQVCFTPPDFGTYTIVITARDECGLTATDSLTLTLVEGGVPLVLCPNGVQYDTLCTPGEVCVVVPVSPQDAIVTISPTGTYDPQTGEVCVEFQETGTIQIWVRAEATCGIDSCSFTMDVVVDNPPVVECRGAVDTLLCLADPVEVCLPVSFSGIVDSIEVLGATYENGYVCVPITEAGQYEILTIAHGICISDTCETVLRVTRDQDPILHLPTEIFSFERCPDDTDHICIDGIWAEDVESDVTITMTCGPGTFTEVTNDSGEVCFVPDGFGTYEFCFEVTDGCNITTGSFTVDVTEEEDCDVCMYIGLESGDCTPVGLVKEVTMTIDAKTPIGGFDLLISFDASVMGFTYATIENTEIHDGSTGWEYFRYTLNEASCSPSCPSGVVRFVAIADVNNGASHPPDETLTPHGAVVRIQFQVANDQNLGDQFLPINFVTYDCGDNAVSDTTGNDLYVDLRIYNPEGYLRWDEMDDVNYPESARPYGLGTRDECFGDGKVDPIRCIEFYDGGICVIHPDSIDDRGDINLNGTAYEIADAVLFSNYFIYGLDVFVVSIPGQIAATDVNADGVTLSVADLVLLIRVIIGDADPIPKIIPYPDDLVLTTTTEASNIDVTTRSTGEVGAALFVFDLEGDIEIDEPTLTADAEKMDLAWNIEDNELRLLVYNMGTERIEMGEHSILQIPYSGDGTLSMTKAEIVDYQGRPYEIAYKSNLLPTSFSLEQNYPNPFNPNTTIGFALAEASDYVLSIYNVEGKLVRNFNGSLPAGNHSVVWDGRSENGAAVASGVYFYRLDAGDYHQTRKMMLLK
ncbi:MAG TPA: FlgD immunoglobulin-like domain containing protein [candidate division Zixibacteria bacterium]|nr:FlgD immunoglobulin-like domain containing protein [candidate division Zixibacteria bacterium]